MISLWEQQSFLSFDVIVVGAGITGLSTAATLKEQDPDLQIAVLEAGVLPTGASTKNAGFACFGSVSELKNDLDLLGEVEMLNLVAKRWDGLQKTSQRLGRAVIDLQQKGGYELIFGTDANTLEAIEPINRALYPLFQQSVFQLSDQKITTFGFAKTNHLIENPFEGQLDTGKLISSLWHYCGELGVKVYTGCAVQSIDEESTGVIIQAGGLSFSSKKIAVCTNAFSNQLLPGRNLDISPGRGTVLAINPKQKLSLEGTFHYEEGYYYFRDYYGKLIFGGGRNLAMEEEATTEPGINPKIKERLLTDLHEIILPNQAFTIEKEWSGVMAFGENKKPIVEKISDRIVLGARLGGMGVAIGSLVGEEVAELIITG